MLFNLHALLMLERGVGTSQPPIGLKQPLLHRDGPVFDMCFQASLASQSLTQVLLDIE